MDSKTFDHLLFFLRNLRDCRTRGPSPGLHKFTVKNATEILESIEGKKRERERDES